MLMFEIHNINIYNIYINYCKYINILESERTEERINVKMMFIFFFFFCKLFFWIANFKK